MYDTPAKPFCFLISGRIRCVHWLILLSTVLGSPLSRTTRLNIRHLLVRTQSFRTRPGPEPAYSFENHATDELRDFPRPCGHDSNIGPGASTGAPREAFLQAVTGAGSTPSWASIVIWSK